MAILNISKMILVIQRLRCLSSYANLIQSKMEHMSEQIKKRKRVNVLSVRVATLNNALQEATMRAELSEKRANQLQSCLDILERLNDTLCENLAASADGMLASGVGGLSYRKHYGTFNIIRHDENGE